MDDLLTELERQLRHSSFFTQASLEKQGKLADKLDTYVTALIDVLLQRSVIDADELQGVVEQHRRTQVEALRSQYETDGTLPAWPNVLVREDDSADPSGLDEVVDCAARMHVCHAVCCTLPFPLSAAEVEAGKVKWDLGHPYLIRHDRRGRCVHNDESTGACGVYDDRPTVCHGYSCANDERIWKDFDAMVINDEFLANRRRHDFTFRPSSGAAVPVTVSHRARTSDGSTSGTALHDVELPVAG